MKKLTSKERKQVKADLTSLAPLVFVGKAGITEEIINEAKRHLRSVKLIKVKVQKSALPGKTKTEIAEELAEKTRSQVIEIKGFTIGLFKGG